MFPSSFQGHSLHCRGLENSVGMGTEVQKLAGPAGTSCCATNMPGTDWIYGGSVPCGIHPFQWGLGILFSTSLTGDEEDETVL